MARYSRIVERIAKALHDKTLKAEDLDQEYITQTYKELSEGAADGYGNDWGKFPKDGKGNTPLYLKRNLYAFSGAKSYAILEKLNDLLVDQDGKLRPFNEFQQLARKEDISFNKNYLQAEFQTARTAAQMAEKWERLQETKDLFPNLKYRTAGDSRVRKDHDKLDGIIKPIDDDFWSKFYPPLDWRCRCDVVATAEDADDKLPEDLPPVKFKGNVGKDKEIFTSKGTFFKLLKTNDNAVKNAELSKLNAPFERAYKNKGKALDVSIYADEIDIEKNIIAGQTLVDNGYNVAIRPHLNGMIITKYKNPEYHINGKIGELKTPESINYKNILKKAHKQSCEFVVINLDKNGDSFENALLKIDAILKFNVHPLIKEVILMKGKKISVYKRKKQPKK